MKMDITYEAFRKNLRLCLSALCFLFLTACQTDSVAVFHDTALSDEKLSMMHGRYQNYKQGDRIVTLEFMPNIKDITLENGKTVQALPFEYRSKKIEFEGFVVFSQIPNSALLLAAFPGGEFKTYQYNKGERTLSPRAQANETHPFVIMKKHEQELSIWLWAKDKDTELRKNFFKGDGEILPTEKLKSYLSQHIDDFTLNHKTQVTLQKSASSKNKELEAPSSSINKEKVAKMEIYEGYVHDLNNRRHKITISRDEDGELSWMEHANPFSFCAYKLTPPQFVRSNHWACVLKDHPLNNLIKGNPIAGCKDQMRIASKEGEFAKALLISALPNDSNDKRRYKIIVSSSSIHMPYSAADKEKYGIAEGEIYPTENVMQSEELGLFDKK